MECIECMLSCIKGSIYICGDFNIDLLSYNVNNNTKKFVDQMFSMPLFPLINKPTRIPDQSHSIIDNIYTNSINEDIISGVIIADVCDHNSILQKDIHKKKTEQFWNIRANSEENISKLNCLLALECWHLVFGANDVNDSYDAFIDIFWETTIIAVQRKNTSAKNIILLGLLTAFKMLVKRKINYMLHLKKILLFKINVNIKDIKMN